MKFFWKYKFDHIIFWLATIIFYAFVRIYLVNKAGIYQYAFEIIIRNALLAFICYFNIYYLFPQYFKKNKYFTYGVYVLLCLLFYTALKNTHDTWLFGFVIGDTSRQNFFYNTYYNFSNALFYVAFTLALELSKKWYYQQQVLQQVQMEKLKTELQFLKAQINPHFLFNSINTIYFQIDKKNTEARESLQKFSELLRYQLYECNEDEIPIEKEIEYLKSYVDLQRLRKNENYTIDFSADETVSGFSIAPLLLMPFVENAFKHLSHNTNYNNAIKVLLQKQDGYFLFDVINSKDDLQNLQLEGEGGLGLKNVKRRLELLYNGKHKLNIKNNDKNFSVQLKLQVQ